MPELAEVFTSDGKPTGVAKPKDQIFRDGDWRLVTHVWIVNPHTKELLIQKRALKKGIFDGLLDVSVGGGVIATEYENKVASEPTDVAAQRETAEELGLELPIEALEFLGRFRVPKFIPERAQPMNEYSDTYLVRKAVNLDELTLQQREVSSVEHLALHALVNEVSDPERYKLWVPHGQEYYTQVTNMIQEII